MSSVVSSVLHSVTGFTSKFKESVSNLNLDAKKRLAIAAAGACCLITVSGTVSYMIDGGRLDNTLTTGGLKLQQLETEWNSEEDAALGEVDGENMHPGYCRLKNPSVKNITGKRNNHAWIRVEMEFLGWDSEQERYVPVDPVRDEMIFYTLRYDSAADSDLKNGTNSSLYPNGTHVSASDLESLPCVNPDYVMLEDSEPGRHVFYLQRPLKSSGDADSGELSTLFTHVMIPSEWGQDELDILGDYQISVIMDGVQQHTFPTMGDAAAYFQDSGAFFSPGSLQSVDGKGSHESGFVFSGLVDILGEQASSGNHGGLGSGLVGSKRGGSNASSDGNSNGNSNGDSNGIDGGEDGSDDDMLSDSSDTTEGTSQSDSKRGNTDRTKAGLIRRGKALRSGDPDGRDAKHWGNDVRSFVLSDPGNLGDTVTDMYDALYEFEFHGDRSDDVYDRILKGLSEFPEDGLKY